MAKRKPISLVAAERAAKDEILSKAAKDAKRLPQLRRALAVLEHEASAAREEGRQLPVEFYKALQVAHDAVTVAERARRLVGEASRVPR